jgi:hypothetical protein
MQASLSPKLSIAVDEPLMPILCSSDAHTTSFGWPSEPSALMRTLGTMKSERPFVPAGAPSTRARTMWMMFSVMSWSPPEMNILVPRIAYVPSASFFAVVRAAPTSEPACGSVKHIVPAHLPKYMAWR